MTHLHTRDDEHSLASIRIFAGLPAKDLALIESQCSWKTHEPGTPIIGYLNTSNDVFFLVQGKAQVTLYSLNGKVVSYRELGPGETFGEYPAIDEGPRSASVEAQTNCLVASMSSSTFLDVLRSQPTVMQTLLRQLVETIRRLTTRIYEFSTLAVNNRIHAELLRLASLGTPDGNSAYIRPAPTHAEIASRISTHREAVTRELNRLSKIGIIDRQGHDLIINDMERLAQIVHEATGE